MKYPFRILVSLALATACCVTVPAESQTVLSGFMTGNDYLEMPQMQRSSYVMGFINGLLVMPLITGRDADISWMHSCITGMTSDQVSAILDKYLADNPSKWHQPLNLLSHNAVMQACPR